MSEIRQVFEVMSSRFRPERSNETLSYYFSVGGEKWTVFVTPDSCDVQQGRQVSSADCVLKCDPDLFAKNGSLKERSQDHWMWREAASKPMMWRYSRN